jgi:rhodanese-related sulfurtransferase
MKWLLAVASAALSLPAVAQDSAPSEAGKIRHVSVTELASWLSGYQKIVVLDANGERVRQSEGVLPGARLLSSFDAYALSELPPQKDARLVFYCVNPFCTSSLAAATRAVTAGYTDVWRMEEGIQGWRNAGNKTQDMRRPKPAVGGR